MKLLKGIILGLSIAVSSVSVISVAHAESDPGRITYTPIEAIGRVLDRIKIAEDAMAAKTPGAEVAKLIKDAKDASKEINSEAVDRLRQNGNGHLARAIGFAKEDDFKVAGEHLKAATEVFNEMKAKLAKK